MLAFPSGVEPENANFLGVGRVEEYRRKATARADGSAFTWRSG